MNAVDLCQPTSVNALADANSVRLTRRYAKLDIFVCLSLSDLSEMRLCPRPNSTEMINELINNRKFEFILPDYQQQMREFNYISR